MICASTSALRSKSTSYSRATFSPADHLVAALPPAAWAVCSAGAGSQGGRFFAWAWIRLPDAHGSGAARWLLARRSLSDPTQIAYFRAFGPAETKVADLIRVAGTRGAIEVGFEDAKGGSDSITMRCASGRPGIAT
jgi:hypothetical protein